MSNADTKWKVLGTVVGVAIVAGWCGYMVGQIQAYSEDIAINDDRYAKDAKARGEEASALGKRCFEKLNSVEACRAECASVYSDRYPETAAFCAIGAMRAAYPEQST